MEHTEIQLTCKEFEAELQAVYAEGLYAGELASMKKVVEWLNRENTSICYLLVLDGVE